MCMNNTVYSTLFKKQERDQSEQQGNRAKKGITRHTHTHTKQGHVTLSTEPTTHCINVSAKYTKLRKRRRR